MKLFSRIYKIFVIFFFKFFYGKINFRRSRSKEIIVEKVNVKNNLYKIFKIKNCRIYTNTNDVAYIKNNSQLKVHLPSMLAYHEQYGSHPTVCNE